MPISTPERAVLQTGSSSVELDYNDLDHVQMRVLTAPVGPGAYDGAALVCEAVTQARANRARHLETMLDASAPACGIVLDALHARIGTEVDRLELHRAGTSIVVDVDLLP